jgi:hypothetical protein
MQPAKRQANNLVFRALEVVGQPAQLGGRHAGEKAEKESKKKSHYYPFGELR